MRHIQNIGDQRKSSRSFIVEYAHVLDDVLKVNARLVTAKVLVDILVEHVNLDKLEYQSESFLMV